MDDILQIKYKETVYTLKELIADNNSFAESLLLFEPSQHGGINFIYDKGYCIAAEKVDQLYGLVATSRFALIEAHKKLHKNPVDWRSGYLGQIWLRSHYLKNSIIWYNSILDYIYQIVWFAFDFFESLETKKDYEKELRKCSWNSLTDINKKHQNENLQKLYSEIHSAKNDRSMVQVNKWANALKHHGSLNIKELHEHDDILLKFAGGLNSKDILGEIVDLDHACLVLQQAHLRMHSLITYVLDFIDFDSMFRKDEKGVYHVELRDKKEYKKIVIDNIYMKK